MERKLDRTAFSVVSLEEQDEGTGLENATPAERLLMVWQVTLDAWAFAGETLTESRLQRHTVRLLRRGG